jgi:SAM-dependent methyltransferase
MEELYTLENAQRFNWSSVTGNLNAERVSHLEKYLVGHTILDAGCGGGAYVDFLSREGFDVTGCDKHSQFLDVAREQKRLGHYVQADVADLDFSDKSFDSTFCFDVLEHVDDRRAIQELARVTRKRLVLAVPREDEVMTRYALTFLHYQDKTHLRNYTEESLAELVSGIDPFRYSIVPELLVPFRTLTNEMVEQENQHSPFRFFSRTAQLRLFRRLLAEIPFRSVPTGLVAVVDLRS